ncbi:MAG: acetyl-CoA carboxylase carboxyl transferase subunit alpha [Bacilli bacterium]|nr:acetyl-CoA carboxylase carboxyl transferase subunit alpha [Bacilli bacterium]
MKKNVLECIKIINHEKRPNSMDYINTVFNNFIELCGDRLYGDDSSLIGGIAYINKTPVTVIGQLRGRNFSENVKYNFSMTLPEGFRKALRLMKQAEKFKRPIICFIDTLGAFPGVQAEERGQATAIANNLYEIIDIKVPIISIFIGNGFSGGALALSISDSIAILENAVFSVISPRACANILWKDSSKEKEAAELIKMTSWDLVEEGIVDYIINEPGEGAHSNIEEISSCVKKYIIDQINIFRSINPSKLVKKRKRKYRNVL